MTPEELKAYRKAYNKERYEFLKSKGICTKCGAEKAKTGKTMCLLCLDKQRETALKSVKKCRNKETYNAYMKEFRDRRKEKGLCQWCGRPTMNGHVFCTEHLGIIARRANEQRRANNVIARELMGNGYYCYFCGEKVEKVGDKCCPVCLEREREWSAEQRKKIDYENHWWRKDNIIVFHKEVNSEGSS